MRNNNTVSAMRIMDALSAVDTELLERCQMDNGRSVSARKAAVKPLWQYGRACAAVVCMVFLGAAAFSSYRFLGDKGFDASYSGGEMDGAAPQQFYLDANDEAETAMEIEDALSAEDIQSAGGQEDLGDGQPEAGVWEGDADTDGLQNGAYDSVTPEDGGELGNNGADSGAKETQGSVGDSENTPQKTDGTSIDDEACRKLQAEEYTLEQARALEDLGSYVPGTLPANYGFERAYRNLEVDEANLTVSWSRGMDYLMLSIKEVKEAPQTVDIGKPETYDVRLYEIPYCDTVPQEYMQTFDNPVFAWEDMSLEIVESRMKSYKDSGDSNTPRGNFSILFPDGIVVRFNGRGTASQIWEMFCSMSAVN